MPIGDFLKQGITGALEGLGNVASNIISKFKADPTKVLEYEKELEEAKINAALKAQELSNQAEETFAKELETVNQTIREESKSEHFLVWSWRPLIGYIFVAVAFNNYVIMPYLKKYGLTPIELPSEWMTAIMIILGVASAGRSATQWQKEKNKS